MRLAACAFTVFLSLGAAAAQTDTAAKPAAAALPDGPGKPIVQKQCATCHTLTVVTSKHASSAEWTQLVNQMVSRGAELTDDEIDTVVEYLAKNFGPLDKAQAPAEAAPPATPEATNQPPGVVNVNKAPAQEMVTSLGFTKAEAEAVVTFRTAGGVFKTWKDVAAVPGGPPSDKIEKLQKQIAF